MSSRRRAAVTGTVAALLSSAVIAAPGAVAAPTAPIACPDALPTASAVDGVAGTGFTVEKGTKPDPFTVKIIGRIENGIAPGVDMIMADAGSPAISRAGGIWAGMSGSPVYTDDGKLIGAVSYGLAGNTPIAGITPAVEMKKLLSAGATAPPAAKVAVDKADAARIARTGKVTKTAAAGGFARLKVPVTVSGVDPKHAAELKKRLTKKLPNALIQVGGPARAAAAPAGEIVAGGNFAAAASYGTATVGGAGTTTFVCNGEAVAFGHPFFFTGASDRYSIHSATALYVQPDTQGAPFKVVNFGGVAGTLTDDRMAGIKGKLGQAPTTTALTSRVTVDGGARKTFQTQAVAQKLLPDLVLNHAWASFDSAYDGVTSGSAAVSLKVAGTVNGKSFFVGKSNRFADTVDISGKAGFWAADQVYALVDQPFADVRITAVSVDFTISSAIQQYRVTGVKVKQGSTWVTGANGVITTAGAKLPVRVTVAPYKSSIRRTVQFDVPVPAAAKGATGVLDVAGGGAVLPSAEPTTWAQFLAQFKAAPGSNSVIGYLDLATESGKAISSAGGVALTQAVAPSETLIDVIVR